MKIKQFGDLIKLAEKQLNKELDSGKRQDYSMLDVIDMAGFLRKQIDKIKITQLYTKKELNRIKYLKNRRIL